MFNCQLPLSNPLTAACAVWIRTRMCSKCRMYVSFACATFSAASVLFAPPLPPPVIVSAGEVSRMPWDWRNMSAAATVKSCTEVTPRRPTSESVKRGGCAMLASESADRHTQVTRSGNQRTCVCVCVCAWRCGALVSNTTTTVACSMHAKKVTHTAAGAGAATSMCNSLPLGHELD
jgi:hypothetical protein